MFHFECESYIIFRLRWIEDLEISKENRIINAIELNGFDISLNGIVMAVFIIQKSKLSGTNVCQIIVLSPNTLELLRNLYNSNNNRTATGQAAQMK